MKPGKYPFNKDLTATTLAKMLAGANIKATFVPAPDDSVDDIIKLENKAHIQVGLGYVSFNYWTTKDGNEVMCFNEVDNFVDLLTEIKKHQLNN